MDSINIGPLVLPLDRLVLLLVAISLLVAVQCLQRRAPTLNGWFTGVLLAAIAGGRLGHVIQYPSLYAEAPWRALYIWQDGYALWGVVVGVGLVSLFFVVFRGLSIRWLAAAAAPAVVVALLGIVVVHNLRPEPIRLAEAAPVFTLTGEKTPLDEAADGRPVSAFLWATWCGVCRQMMPDVMEAAQRSPERQWFLVNVGEQPAQVQSYLSDHGDDWPENVRVVMDPDSQLLRDWRAHGVPTTVLFNADGVQVDRFMGRRSVSRLLSH